MQIIHLMIEVMLPLSLLVGAGAVWPLLFPDTDVEALRSQDQFLAGFILMFISLLVLVGMLISDIMLALLDPRIRLTKRPRS